MKKNTTKANKQSSSDKPSISSSKRQSIPINEYLKDQRISIIRSRPKNKRPATTLSPIAESTTLAQKVDNEIAATKPIMSTAAPSSSFENYTEDWKSTKIPMLNSDGTTEKTISPTAFNYKQRS